ncbi:MAG: hypothetical protein AAF525_19045, partial [Pseudomonadota bacterium]
ADDMLLSAGVVADHYSGRQGFTTVIDEFGQDAYVTAVLGDAAIVVNTDDFTPASVYSGRALNDTLPGTKAIYSIDAVASGTDGTTPVSAFDGPGWNDPGREQPVYCPDFTSQSIELFRVFKNGRAFSFLSEDKICISYPQLQE